MDFGCHVPPSSAVSHQPGSALCILVLSIAWTCKSKVIDQQLVVSIKQDVFSFEISMGNVVLVAGIESLDQLLEEISANVLRELPIFGELVEHLSILG